MCGMDLWIQHNCPFSQLLRKWSPATLLVLSAFKLPKTTVQKDVKN